MCYLYESPPIKIIGCNQMDNTTESNNELNNELLHKLIDFHKNL